MLCFWNKAFKISLHIFSYSQYICHLCISFHSHRKEKDCSLLQKIDILEMLSALWYQNQFCSLSVKDESNKTLAKFQTQFIYA